ncbi:MAG: hypothetical protein ACK501_11890 [Planctomycetota bacterium]
MNNPSPSTRPSSLGRTLGLAVATVGAAVVVAVTVLDQKPAASTSPALPAAAPAAVAQQPKPRPRVQLALHHAERFTLETPYQHRYRVDEPWVTDGWLLVLSTDPSLLKPRQVKEPVLYVGAQTAERVNAGLSGKIVVLVPGDFALATAPIFLGDAALPEELRQADIDAQLAAAVAAGAIATPAETITKVTAPARTFATDFELRQRAIDLVEIHSPQEKDLIAGWRLPRVR